MPGGPVTDGADVVLTEIPPMTISTISVKPSINPIVLFCEYILVRVGQKHIKIYVVAELTAYTLLPKII